MPDNTAGSSLLLDVYLAEGDPRFLGEVFRSASGKKLKALAEPWFRDARPVLRQALLAYIDDGCDRREHRALVKQLFKLAEAAGDDEVIGHFMVAFDRYIQRRLTRASRWDWSARQNYTVTFLKADPSVPRTKQSATAAGRFTRNTRLYLARRAWRYFRYLAYRDASRYAAAMRHTLPLYEDRHLGNGAQLIDAWGLMHALYWASPVLVRSTRGIRVSPTATLAQLEPAPFFPEVWKENFAEVFTMMLRAQSRTVRKWAIAILRANFATELAAIELESIRGLLAHEDEELQLLGIDLLRKWNGVETLPISTWLELLAIESLDVRGTIAELMARHVAPSRLSLEQTVQLAVDRSAPTAELGLRWLKERPILGADELQALMLLRNAETPLVRGDAVAWLLGQVKQHPAFTVEHLRDLIDSRFEDVRTPALALMKGEERFTQAESLWRALAESPYGDVRDALVAHLETVERMVDPASIRFVWVTGLLAIHRGGRAKQTILKQIAARIVSKPADADALLPLLAIALRSVRAPERRNALGVIAQAAFRRSELRARVAAHLPELTLFPEEVA